MNFVLGAAVFAAGAIIGAAIAMNAKTSTLPKPSSN